MRSLPALRLDPRPLVALAAAFTALLAGLALWPAWKAMQQTDSGAEAELVQVAKTTAARQQAWLVETGQLLRLLGGISVAETAAASGEAACSDFLARQLQRLGDYDNLAFITADGRIRCSARPGLLPALPLAAGPGRLRLVFLADAVTALWYREPGWDTPDAAVAAVIPLASFLGGAQRSGAGFSAILDGRGRLLAVQPAGALAGPLADVEPGTVARLTQGGRDYLYTTQPIAGAGEALRLVVGMPASGRPTRWAPGGFALALGAGLLALALWRARGSSPGWPAWFAQARQRARWRTGTAARLRRANRKLRAALAEKETRLQQVLLLDALSRRLQVCADAGAVARAVAECAQRLFPAGSGALFQWTGEAGLEAVLTWGTAAGPVRSVRLPLVFDGERLGALELAGIGEPDPTVLASLAERAAAGMAATRREARLRNRALRDPLTGLHNRRFLEETMDAEQRRALRTGATIGLLLVDIDHFKRFNDAHGHDAGDALLRGVGTLLRHAVREGDTACRYGGEEFVVVLPGADLAGTAGRAETLRAAIARWHARHEGVPLGPVTVSIGVAVLPLHGRDWRSTLRAADQALYAAKHAGRNRVVVAPLP